MRHIGPVALATGLGQLGFTIAGGFVLILLLGQNLMTALYVSVALTFSSTIIIVKLLTDKRELDSLHGRIAVGFLIVQDIAVVLAMMAMSALRVPEGQAAPEGWVVALSLVARLALAVVLVAAVMRWVLPRLVTAMARSQELLLVFAMAWGLGLAALGAWAGFSMEAGAFVAGFTLANTPYREAIHARLSGIRDFLLLFFFIHLGAELEMSTLGDALGPALVPVDFLPWSAPTLALVDTMAPHALVELLHVYTVPFEEKLRFAGVDDDTIAHYRERTRAQAHARLLALAHEQGWSPSRYRVHLYESDAAPAVVRSAQEWGCDLVALGKHGQGVAEELLLGSVTKHVVAEASCDVLVSPAAQRV